METYSSIPLNRVPFVQQNGDNNVSPRAWAPRGLAASAFTSGKLPETTVHTTGLARPGYRDSAHTDTVHEGASHRTHEKPQRQPAPTTRHVREVSLVLPAQMTLQQNAAVRETP